MLERPKFVSFRLSEDEAAALQRAATASQIDRSTLIRLKLLELTSKYIKPVVDPRQTDLFQGSKK